MNDDFHTVTGTYAEAVTAMHEHWRKTRRACYLRSGNDRAGHWWHRVDAKGNFTDRNTVAGTVGHVDNFPMIKTES